MFMANRLGKEMTDPIGVPTDIPQFCLLDMYTACTLPNAKDSILKSIPCEYWALAGIVGTIAFRMVLDCSNIRKIIHWGPLGDTESYMLEPGQAGCDGEFAETL